MPSLSNILWGLVKRQTPLANKMLRLLVLGTRAYEHMLVLAKEGKPLLR